jgi:sugar lactone lactonase YvrE
MRTVYAVVALLLSAPLSAQSLSVTTFAGTDGGPGYRDGAGSAARFVKPYGITVDASGNILVADLAAHNIRKITPSGDVTTLAGVADAIGSTDGLNGVARFNAPHAIAVDTSGNVYVAESSLRKISPSGTVTTLVASVPALSGIALDSGGNIFATESASNLIRKITPGGSMTDFASTDGSAHGLTIDSSDNLYFTTLDGGVFKCTPQGVITTIADDVRYPGDLDVDASGNLYVISGEQIKKFMPGGTVVTFAGSGSQGQRDGVGTEADFLDPRGLELSPDGTLLYVADYGNNAIRKITVPGAAVTTLAGKPRQRGMTDGAGLDARFSFATDAAVAPDGNVYVVDYANNRIRKITPAGVTSTFAGSTRGTADGLGVAAQFDIPLRIAVGHDHTGNWVLYVTDASRIRKITHEGYVSTVATSLSFPRGIAVSASGSIYVADGVRHTIMKIDIPSHTMTVFAGASGMPGDVNGTGAQARFRSPHGLAIDAGGKLYVSDSGNNRIRQIDLATSVVTTYAGSGSSGSQDGTGASATFSDPRDIHAIGNDLYVADTNGVTVRLIEPGAVVSTVAGKPAPWAHRDGTGAWARFQAIGGLGGDSNRNLYICDTDGSNIRRAGIAGIADIATASDAAPLPHAVVQLGTEPDTATSWIWSIERRPPGSTAELSSTTIRNPTFTPDVADLYTFLLRAEGPDGVRYSTVNVMARGCSEPLRSVTASATTPAVCESGSYGTASVSVAGGNDVTYQWGYRTTSGGRITPIAGETSPTYAIEETDLGGGTGTRYLVVTVTPECGVQTVSNQLPIELTSPADATITASSGVFANTTENFASVAHAGTSATYAWSITNGTITAGQGTWSIEYKAGGSGVVTLSVTITRYGCLSNGNTNVPIQERPAGSTMLYVVTPCRIVDTRHGPALASSESYELRITGTCGIPSDAKSIVANITAVTPVADGWLAVWPADTPWGGTSTMSYRAGRTRATNAIIRLSSWGRVQVLNNGGPQHVVIDVTGYFR